MTSFRRVHPLNTWPESGADTEKPVFFVTVTWTSFDSEKPFFERQRDSESAVSSLYPRDILSGVDMNEKTPKIPTVFRMSENGCHVTVTFIIVFMQ